MRQPATPRVWVRQRRPPGVIQTQVHPPIANGHSPDRPRNAEPPGRTQQRGRTPIRRDLSRAAVRFLLPMRPR
jgi:hypothetical protein